MTIAAPVLPYPAGSTITFCDGKGDFFAYRVEAQLPEWLLRKLAETGIVLMACTEPGAYRLGLQEPLKLT